MAGEVNAKGILLDMLGSLDYEAEPERWRFLNTLVMAVNGRATASLAQRQLLDRLYGEIRLGKRSENGSMISLDAIVIATWINSFRSME